MKSTNEGEIEPEPKLYRYQITCPKCDHMNGDSWEMPEDGEDECSMCGQKFTFERDIIYNTWPKETK